MPARSAPEGAPVSSDPPGYPRELECGLVTGGLRDQPCPFGPAARGFPIAPTTGAGE